MSHANARLTPAGRLLLVRRVAAGEPQAEATRQMRLSRATVAKWWHRWVEFGDAGLADRSSRPNRSPRRTDAATEERICRLRRSTKRGPVYLSARTGVPASTIWRVLRRHGLNRLDRLDRPTGRTIRRYEKAAPGELVHLDVKKSRESPARGRLESPRPRQPEGPPLPRRRVHLSARRRRRLLPGRLRRGTRQRDGGHPGRVLDPGPGLVLVQRHGRGRGHDRQRAQLLLGALRRDVGAAAHRAPAHPPVPSPTDGKAERFNRTLAEEFLYAKRFRSETDRRIRLKRWICDYNCHRHHTAVGGPPASRANNLTRTDSLGPRSPGGSSHRHSGRLECGHAEVVRAGGPEGPVPRDDRAERRQLRGRPRPSAVTCWLRARSSRCARRRWAVPRP